MILLPHSHTPTSTYPHIHTHIYIYAHPINPPGAKSPAVDMVNNAPTPKASHIGLCQGSFAFAEMAASPTPKDAAAIYMKVGPWVYGCVVCLVGWY